MRPIDDQVATGAWEAVEMVARHVVRPEALHRSCDPASLGFETTAELPELPEVLCQERAVEAIEFAVGMPDDGYNVFVLGPEGTGKQTLLRQILARTAASDPVPADACYVQNFSDPQRPRALLLPAGVGRRLRTDMEHLVIELRGAIRAAFESEAYRGVLEAMEDELRSRRDRALDSFSEIASSQGFAVIRSPIGISLTPAKEGHPLEPKDFEALSPVERKTLETASEELEQQLAQLIRQLPKWEREHRARVRELGRDMTHRAVGHLIDELRTTYHDQPEVLEHLSAVQEDVVENAEQLLEGAGSDAPGQPTGGGMAPGSPPWARRYLINLIVDRGDTTGAPVVLEDYPSLPRLVGRVEHVSVQGALLTDFTLIRPGALHRANGGYLVLDIRKILLQPMAWEGLKRALSSRQLRPESIAEALSLVSTVSLEPEPIPLRVKVALVGDRSLYYLLAALDPEFRDLFKAQADVDDDIERTRRSTERYAQLIAGLARRESLAPLDAPAVARVIEEMARHADAGDRLSADMRFLSNLLREANRTGAQRRQQHGRRHDGHADCIGRADVEAALAGQRRRGGRIQERMQEAIENGMLLVDTRGTVSGQVNALTVAELGETHAAWPTRVTASVRLGRGEVIDIEREVDLGGPIHSKGVLILSGFLGQRYARTAPLSLHASLAFEQSYGPIEGDSASLAEACALLSAIGELPIRGSLAVTGSVDQCGRVQAVGAVNAKIEGFFDVCATRGLTGAEGVIIPVSNVRTLMLRSDVVEAARAGRFTVHAVGTVDEAMALLTGLPAGRLRRDGSYPPRTVNGAVERRLRALADVARSLVEPHIGSNGVVRPRSLVHPRPAGAHARPLPRTRRAER